MHRIVVVLVQRDGEDVSGVSVTQLAGIHGRSGPRGQGIVGGASAGEDGGGAVAVVDIAVHGHGGADLVIALHAPDGHGHVMNHAETFAVVGEGVVKAAANVNGDALFQCVLRSQDRATGRKPEGAYQVLGVRDFHLHFFAGRERAVL